MLGSARRPFPDLTRRSGDGPAADGKIRERLTGMQAELDGSGVVRGDSTASPGRPSRQSVAGTVAASRAIDVPLCLDHPMLDRCAGSVGTLFMDFLLDRDGDKPPGALPARFARRATCALPGTLGQIPQSIQIREWSAHRPTRCEFVKKSRKESRT